MIKFVYKLSLSLRWVFKTFDIFRNILFNRRASHVILEYHSVGTDVQIELDISVDIFEQHLRYLKTNCDVVSLDHYLKTVEGEQELIKPVVALTFDDGYDNFYTKVLPLLKKYDLPATLFPALNFIDEPINVPIKSSIGDWNEFKPLSMSELRSVVDSPLINVQSHGYAHLDFSLISEEEAREDIIKSNTWLHKYLNINPVILAYPRGLINNRNIMVVKE